MQKPLESKESSLAASPKLGSVLVSMNLITEEDLVKAIQRGIAKKTLLGELLVSEGVITHVDLAKALCEQYNLEYLDLDAVILNRAAAKLLPEKIARKFLLLPIEAKDGVTTLTSYDPIQLVKLDNLKAYLTGTIVLKVSTKQQIENALNKIYAAENSSVDKIVTHLAKKQGERKSTYNSNLTATLTTGKDNTPSIESLVNKFLEKGITDRASDIHIDPADGKVRLRIRIDGILHEFYTYPVELHAAVVSRIKVLAQLDISEKRQPQDGRFHHASGPIPVDIRVSTLPTVHGEKLVMRILDKDKMKGNLIQVGMSPEMESAVQTLLLQPHGMIFITGPTGSGKTTSLYSMLNQVNGIEKNIITAEDPVEFKFDIINQVQVNEKAGLGFAGLLRNILRQDPDVIMIGEVRDRETADLAIRAALTGHLVLSTLHTNNAISTPNRLIDMGVEPFLISSALTAVIAQRLVRVLCPHCKQKIQLTDEDVKLLGTSALQVGHLVNGPVGCDQCMHSGYSGRIALFELLIVDEHIRRSIMDRESEVETLKHVVLSGFISMRQDGVYKIAAGITSVEEVLKATL